MPPGTDRPGRVTAEIRDVSGQSATDAGPTGAGLLYDARRDVYYARPALRGWLHLLYFLIAGTATPVYLLCAPDGVGPATLIVMWALTLTAAAVRLALPAAPERVAGALFIGLGCTGGLALPWARTHAAAACQFAAIARFAG